MNNEPRRNSNRLIRCIRAPLRAFCRACDYYVRSMNSLAGRLASAAEARAMSFPCFASDDVLSFGNAQRSSAEEDLRELIRFASQRSVITSGELVRRNRSVAVGRIDEDVACDFVGEVRLGESLIFPRSRTSAAGGKGPL